MFKKIGKYDLVKEVIGKCPWIIDVKKESATQADPYIIALVIDESKKQMSKITNYTDPTTYVIVTEDNGLRNAGRSYKIKSVKLLNMFEIESWSF